ncbi:MAG: hypothetical protein IJL62_00430 [Clostridia bacterium]|nr:hypothetical protein [Clostridia bacterium]
MIERNAEKTPYTAVKNKVIRSGMLSAEELGLYTVMLSKPDYWEFSEFVLARELNAAPAEIRRILKRLEQKGFARERTGSRGAVWDLYEISCFMGNAGKTAPDAPKPASADPPGPEKGERTMTNAEIAQRLFAEAARLRSMNRALNGSGDCQNGESRV